MANIFQYGFEVMGGPCNREIYQAIWCCKRHQDIHEGVIRAAGYKVGLLEALDAVLALKSRLTRWDVHTLRRRVEATGTLEGG